MGQYYHPSILKKNWKTAKNPVECSLYSHRFGSGLKLMEHSYAGNGFVGAMCYLLAKTYKGYPFVWVGDYADRQITNAYPEGKPDKNGECGAYIYGFGSDVCDTEKNKELTNSLIANGATRKQYTYAINYTKGEFVKIPKFNKEEWRIHPLPLLCCDGCGRGLGDYGIDDDRIGSWAYDCIGVTNSKKETEGLKEINGVFKPDW